MKPYFSIVMAVQNREDLVSEAITSIIEQTYENWELIAVDDHSADNTLDVLKSFKDKRMRVFKAPKHITGISQVRNFGNKKTQADIIVVADSDDYNYSHRLQVMYDYFEENSETDVFYGNIDVFDIETNDIHPRWFQPFVGELLGEIDFIPHPASAYKRNSYLKVEGYDSKFLIAEDWDLWLQFYEAEMKFGWTKEPLIRYRKHKSGISQKSINRRKLFERMVKKKHGLSEEKLTDVIIKLASPELRDTYLKKR